MDTQKRRVLYFSDEVWDQSKKEAASAGMTVSAYFRSLVVGGRLVPIAAREELERVRNQHVMVPNPYRGAPKLASQAERDAILRRINAKPRG